MRDRAVYVAKPLILFLALLPGFAFVAPAKADPAIVDYVCVPPLPKDGHMTIDWNAGKNVILMRFPPNPQPTKLAFVASDYSFRYEKGKTAVFAKGDRELTLQMNKNPLRICTRTGPFREQHPEQHPEDKVPPPENPDAQPQPNSQ